MDAKFVPLSVIEVIDMIISGREKLATELVTELKQYEATNRRKFR